MRLFVLIGIRTHKAGALAQGGHIGARGAQALVILYETGSCKLCKIAKMESGIDKRGAFCLYLLPEQVNVNKR